MASSTKQLRAVLNELQDYELPSKYLASDKVAPVVDENQLVQYFKERDAHFSKRHEGMMLEVMETWDGNSFECDIQVSDEDRQQIELERREAQLELKQTAEMANQKLQTLRSKWAHFCTRRDELARFVEESEEKYASQDDDGSVMSDDDNNSISSVTEDDMALQDQRLSDLTNRVTQAEAELQSLRNATALANAKRKRVRESVEKMKRARQATTSVEEPDLTDVAEINKRTVEMNRTAAEFSEMKRWYEDIRDVMEGIGGFKILYAQDHDDGLQMKLLLGGKHEVLVDLSPKTTTSCRVQDLVVTGAKFVTDTLVTYQGETGQSTIVQMKIPPLDDLVSIAETLGPGRDVRFLLREIQARIRTITARVNELGLLRTKYLTKVGKSYTVDLNFGGRDQEIICSLKSGTTAKITLTPDCPMMSGSATLTELVGVGGWTEAVLQQVCDKVNATRYRGPLQLMETLTNELEKYPEPPTPPSLEPKQSMWA